MTRIEPSVLVDRQPGAFGSVRRTISAVVGALLGLAPHVLHHVGLLAGAGLVTGAGGNLLFGVVGLVMSLPLLRSVYRRFGTWKAPAIALAVFAVMFALSAFVVGPALAGSSPAESPSAPQQPSSGHTSHHG